MCGVVLAARGFAGVSAAHPPDPLAIGVSIFAALFSMISLFWVFSFTGMDARGQFTGFPSRLFTLPLTTRRLAVVPVIAGVVTIALAYAMWFGLLSALTSERASPLLFWWQLLVLATTMVLIQAIVWLLHPFRRTRVVVLIAACTACFWFWVWVPGMEFFGHPAICLCTVLAAFVAAVAGAIRVVEWDRRGGWPMASRGRANASSRQRAHAFSNNKKAQAWFEWRRKGIFGATVLASVMGLSLLLWPLPSMVFRGDSTIPPAVEWMVFWSLPIMALLIAHVLGSAFAKPDVWSPELEMPGFTAVRPVTTVMLLRAKLYVAARMTILAWGAFATFVGFVVLRAELNPAGHAFWAQFGTTHPALSAWLGNPVVIATLVALTWQAIVSGMTVTLSGQRARILARGGIGLAFGALFAFVVIWLYRHPRQLAALLDVLPFIAAIVVALKIGWLARRLVIARARNVLNGREARDVVLASAVIAAGLAGSAAAAHQLHAMASPLIWFFAALLLPGGEIAAGAVNLDENRHR